MSENSTFGSDGSSEIYYSTEEGKFMSERQCLERIRDDLRTSTSILVDKELTIQELRININELTTNCSSLKNAVLMLLLALFTSVVYQCIPERPPAKSMSSPKNPQHPGKKNQPTQVFGETSEDTIEGINKFRSHDQKLRIHEL